MKNVVSTYMELGVRVDSQPPHNYSFWCYRWLQPTVWNHWYSLFSFQRWSNYGQEWKLVVYHYTTCKYPTIIRIQNCLILVFHAFPHTKISYHVCSRPLWEFGGLLAQKNVYVSIMWNALHYPNRVHILIRGYSQAPDINTCQNDHLHFYVKTK